MDKLSRYLQRQFFAQALTIFLAGGALIWLMQLLRLFDLVAAQGQNILTLMGQSALTTPTYARTILYVCFAIGLVRALRALQGSRELHTIHAAQRTSSLWKAITVFTLVGALAVSITAHFIEPASKQKSVEWSAEIAADLVGRSLTPGRFSSARDGLVFNIAERQSDGTLVDFFFDDTTNADTRRTYFAETANVYKDSNGYQLILNDGSIQYESRDATGISHIQFVQYHISLSTLIEESSPNRGLDQLSTPRLFELIADKNFKDSRTAYYLLHGRFADGLRALALALFVTAACAFPSGRRRDSKIPMELVVLIVAFGEQVLSGFMKGTAAFYAVPSVIIILSILWFAVRTQFAYRPVKKVKAVGHE